LLCRPLAAHARRRGRCFHAANDSARPDVAPIHDRQMVVLEREDWQAWLDLSEPEKELLQTLASGSLHVEQVR
jgi:putative SOS response-associated peptidase YedK